MMATIRKTTRKTQPHAIRDRIRRPDIQPIPWTKADDIAADYVLNSHHYDPLAYARPISAEPSTTPAPLPEYALGYTFRGEGNGCAL